MSSCSPAQQPAISKQQLEVQQQQQSQHQPPAAAVHAPPSSSDQRALSAVAQLSAALPAEASPVHAQLAALLSTIKAGVEERQALSKQGNVLLDLLLMQPAARR